jgi:hypothetical protein
MHYRLVYDVLNEGGPASSLSGVAISWAGMIFCALPDFTRGHL